MRLGFQEISMAGIRMDCLRVVAVETMCDFIDNREPIMGCVYKDNELLIYDVFGNLWHSKDYLGDFAALDSCIKKGKFDWTDFTINSGQVISRDDKGVLTVDGWKTPCFRKLSAGTGEISSATMALFREYLEVVDKYNPGIVAESFGGYGNLEQEIRESISADGLQDLSGFDKQIIVKARIFGRKFVLNYLRDLKYSEIDPQINQAFFFFSRLFTLEVSNYIFIE